MILEYDANEEAIVTYQNNFSFLYWHCRGANRGKSKESGVSGNSMSFEMITFRILHRPASKQFFTNVTRESNMVLNS